MFKLREKDSFVDFFFFWVSKQLQQMFKNLFKKNTFCRTIMRNGWIPFVVLWKGCNYNLFIFSLTYCWFFNLDLIFIRSCLDIKYVALLLNGLKGYNNHRRFIINNEKRYINSLYSSVHCIMYKGFVEYSLDKRCDEMLETWR